MTNKYAQVAEDLMTVVPMLKGIIAKNKESPCAHSHSSKIEYVLLHTIKKRSVSMSELGDLFGISKPNMTVIIDKLIQEKKVKRSYDDKDRRIIRVDITALGEMSMERLRDEMKKRIEKSLSCIPTKDIESFHESVKNIKAILSRVTEPEVKK